MEGPPQAARALRQDRRWAVLPTSYDTALREPGHRHEASTQPHIVPSYCMQYLLSIAQLRTCIAPTFSTSAHMLPACSGQGHCAPKRGTFLARWCTVFVSIANNKDSGHGKRAQEVPTLPMLLPVTQTKRRPWTCTSPQMGYMSWCQIGQKFVQGRAVPLPAACWQHVC